MKHAPFTKNAHLNRNTELNIPDNAFAAAVLAVTATVASQAELAEHDWVSSFKNFGVGDARVGHVCVYAAGAVPGGTCAGSASDGFVVAEAFGGIGRGGGSIVTAEAEGEVVAVALGGGAGLEAVQDDVRHALALFGENKWF